ADRASWRQMIEPERGHLDAVALHQGLREAPLDPRPPRLVVEPVVARLAGQRFHRHGANAVMEAKRARRARLPSQPVEQPIFAPEIERRFRRRTEIDLEEQAFAGPALQPDTRADAKGAPAHPL